jgi:hypothetical protein
LQSGCEVVDSTLPPLSVICHLQIGYDGIGRAGMAVVSFLTDSPGDMTLTANMSHSRQCKARRDENYFNSNKFKLNGGLPPRMCTN